MHISWKTCLTVGVSAFLLFLAVYYWPAVSGALGVLAKALGPLILGAAIAYVVNILMSFYERHIFEAATNELLLKVRRPFCMLLALATIVAIVAMVLGLVVPELIRAIKLLIVNVPSMIDTGVDFLRNLGLLSLSSQSSIIADVQNFVSSTLSDHSDEIRELITATTDFVTSFFSVTVNTLIALFFALYILLAKERLAEQYNKIIDHYLPAKTAAKVHYVLGVCNQCFRGYIVGQFIEAVILGTLCAIGMTIFRFPYAVMTGAVVGMTALIPIAGAYIGGAVGFLLILTVSPLQAVLFLVYLVVLQQLEGNFIYPKVVGTQLGLPGIWVLAAVIVGAGVSGVLGMVLAVPLAATAYNLLRDDVYGRSGIREGKQ